MQRRNLRIAAVLALILAAGAGYRWWVSPERQIRAIFGDVEAAFTHDAPGSGLDALTDVAALQQHLAEDVSIQGAGGMRVDGRQDAITAAARIRAAAPARRLRFFDTRITFESDRAATVSATAEVTTRNEAGEDLVDVHQVSATVIRPEGRWIVSTARAVPEAKPES